MTMSLESTGGNHELAQEGSAGHLARVIAPVMALDAAARARVLALLAPFVVLALWYWATLRNWIAPQLLPSPSVVWDTFTQMLRSGQITANLAWSLRRVLFGFGIGAFFGLVLGWAMGLSKVLERLLYPSVVAIAQVPALGFIPLAMMFLGIGESLKLVIVAKAVFVPVLIHSMRGVGMVPAGYWELASVNEHRWLATLLRVVIPASLYQVVTGLRLALSQAWLALVTVELLASSEGIGYVMIQGRQLNQIDVVLVTAVIIGVAGFLLDAALERLERLLPGCDRTSRQPARRVRLKSNALGLGLIAPALFCVLWFWASRERWFDSRFVPSPAQFLETFNAQLFGGELLTDIGWSLQRMLAGLLIGGSVGIIFGVLLGRVHWLGSALLPSFNAFRQVTLIAWIPLLTLWLGQGEEAKQTFIALAAFVPVGLAAFEGTRAVSAANKELSAVFCVTGSAQLRWLVLPSALPHVFSGLELSLVYAWLATIGAEYFFKVSPGVGNAMIDGREHFRMDLVLSAVVVVGVLGFVLNRAVLLLRSRLLNWANQ